jgi:hypothetical protein
MASPSRPLTSPFPGVDPYLESQGYWPDFHATFLISWREALADLLPDQYEARIDERVSLVETLPPGKSKLLEPDVALERRGPAAPALAPAAGGLLEAVTVPLALDEERPETYLKILHRPERELVTVLELLSPSNKEEPGRSSYVAKRNALLLHEVHLVEVDLLRGGQRLPMGGPLPAGDYLAFVARAELRPDCSVYAWGVRQRLPVIPIPLLAPDPDVHIDLAAVFATAYQRGRYARSIDYGAIPAGLKAEDRDWVAQQAQARSGG